MSVVPLRDTLCVVLWAERNFCLWYPWSEALKCHTNSSSLFDLQASEMEGGQDSASNLPGPWILSDVTRLIKTYLSGKNMYLIVNRPVCSKYFIAYCLNIYFLFHGGEFKRAVTASSYILQCFTPCKLIKMGLIYRFFQNVLRMFFHFFICCNALTSSLDKTVFVLGLGAAQLHHVSSEPCWESGSICSGNTATLLWALNQREHPEELNVGGTWDLGNHYSVIHTGLGTYSERLWFVAWIKK